MNGLDLCSGIGAVSEALAPWMRTIAYCEIDAKARGILLSRQYRGEVDAAPVWDDIRTLRGFMVPRVDIITAGFPCQDISLAGRREGLAGVKSSIFWEVVRLTFETKAPFVFLENVWPGVRKFIPTIRNAFECLGYECRDGVLSAADVGARHKRQRWFMLAHVNGIARRLAMRRLSRAKGAEAVLDRVALENGEATDAHCPGVEIGRPRIGSGSQEPFGLDLLEGNDWDEYASFLLRMDHGFSHRGDRIRALGNTNPPAQYRQAFKILAGL